MAIFGHVFLLAQNCVTAYNLPHDRNSIVETCLDFSSATLPCWFTLPLNPQRFSSFTEVAFLCFNSQS